MTTILPTFPRFVFTIFEPLSLISGFAGAIWKPEWFIAEQIVSSPQKQLSQNSILVALQLGNLYLLLALIGIAVLYTTTDPKVVRNYLIALALGDIGHLYVTYHVLGYDRFIDVDHWNVMTFGNILITAFLLVTRFGYVVGVFGPWPAHETRVNDNKED